MSNEAQVFEIMGHLLCSNSHAITDIKEMQEGKVWERLLVNESSQYVTGYNAHGSSTRGANEILS
jgi:hypothetical protein